MRRIGPVGTMFLGVLGVVLLGCHRPIDSSRASWAEEHHIVKCGLPYDKTISDPRTWALIQFADGPIDGPEAGAWARSVVHAGLNEAEADLDADGKPELFLRRDIRVQARAWAVLVFTPVRGGYRYMGSLNGTAFRILPKGEDGQPRLQVFEVRGGHQGCIGTYRNNGKAFECVSTQRLECGDGAREEDRRRLDQFCGAGSSTSTILKWR